MLCFSVALSFKAQPMFLAPFIFVLLLKRLTKWRYILLPPIVYFLLVLPCALLGRSLLNLMTIYLTQGTVYHRLSVYALNPYLLLDPVVPKSYYLVVVISGLLLATVAGLAIGLAAFKSRVRMDHEVLLKCAVLCAALMPFILPKVHDRYFFSADIISIVLAFYLPRYWFVPLLFQYTSAVAYVPYLSMTDEVTGLGYTAAVMNGLMIVFLVWVYGRALFPNPTEELPRSPEIPA